MPQVSFMRADSGDTRVYRFAAGLSILFATVLRLWNVADTATLNLHIIRQMIGAMQARNMARGVTPMFEPSIDVAWLPSSPPWFVSLEFPFLPWMSAGFYRVFGTHVWIGNVLSIGFSACAAWVFYLIARRLLDSEVGALAALLPFLFLPEAYKYSRLIQPDALSLFLFVALVYFVMRWIDEERVAGDGRTRWFVLTLLALAFLLLNKINYAPLALVPLSVIGFEFGWRRVLRADIIAGVLVAISPAAIWYVWAPGAAEFDQFGALASGSVLSGLASNWYDTRFWTVLLDGVAGWLLFPGMLVTLVGLVLAVMRRRGIADRILLVWVASTALYFYVAGPDLLAPHRYYFLPLLPIACLLMGLTVAAVDSRFGRGAERRPHLTAAAVVGAAIVLAGGSWWMLRGYYAETRDEMHAYEHAAELVREHTDPGDLVVFETEDWGITLFISYSAERSGWTRVTAEELSEVRDRGARYAFVSSAPYAEKYFGSDEEAQALEDRRQAIKESGATLVASIDEGELYQLADGDE